MGKAPEEEPDWPRYYELAQGRGPRDTLVQALEILSTGSGGVAQGQAVDLGCGQGNDTLELLARGFEVLAIDGHPAGFDYLRAALQPEWKTRLQTRVLPFSEASWPAADLINASFSLSFCPPDDFPGLWAKIRSGLKPGGVFAGQFFGDRDDWASLPGRSHWTRQEIETLLEGWDLHRLEEDEADSQTLLGDPKHWHLFHVVAQRPKSLQESA